MKDMWLRLAWEQEWVMSRCHVPGQAMIDSVECLTWEQERL